MQYTVREINKLIEDIRAGRPPQMPENTREEHYHDPAFPGFYIRVLHTGVASWIVQWKRLGRQKKLTLGNVLVLDRTEAIKAAKELLAKITLDILDPHKARRERMRGAKVTFATVASLFMKAKKDEGIRFNTEQLWGRYFTGYYFKPLHNIPIDEITSEQIQARVDLIKTQSGVSAAEHCYTPLNVFFNWAIETGKLPEDHRNPMDKVQLPTTNPSRDRVLTDEDIQLILKTCDDWEAQAIHWMQIKASTGKWPPSRGFGTPPNIEHPRAIKLLFLTGCRAQEIGGLQHSEVDLDNAEMKIPPSRTKNKKELCTPLADWAVQILRTIPKRPNDDFIFGNSRRTVGLNLARLHKKIDTRIIKAGGTPPPPWTTHDIRRTFCTRLAALGVSMEVGEALVGHVVRHISSTRHVYVRYEFWAEKRQALAMWEANLRAIVDGTAEKIARPRFGERQNKGGTT